MHHHDLADYLDSDPFPESSEPRHKGSPHDELTARQNQDPAPQEQPKRSDTFERDKHESDVLRMVMEVFEGARRTTREEYQRLAYHRDRRGRKTRA